MRKTWLMAAVMLCSMAMPLSTAYALDDVQEQTRASVLSEEEQTQVLQALRAARSGKWAEAEKIVKRTGNKTAIDLYYWLYYTNPKQSGSVDFRRLSTFIGENKNWPEQRELRTLAEKSMPDALPDSGVIAWFDDFAPATPEGMDRYIGALVRQGQSEQAKEKLRDWWTRATLSNDQQRFFLSRHGGMIDRESHIRRFNRVLDIGQHTNARALAGAIGKGYAALAEARIALDKGSKNVNQLIGAVPPHLADDPGLMLARLQWRRKNNQDFGAIEILQNMPDPSLIPNPKEWWEERNIMTRRMMAQGKLDTAYLLVENHGLKEGVPFVQAQFLSGWLALRTNKPTKAFEHFEALYLKAETPISKARGAYWAAKASDKLGHKDIATQWYQVAAQYQTTFYGQMAVGALDASHRPVQQVQPEPTAGDVANFNRRDMVQAARLLSKAGYKKETTEFLDALAFEIKDPPEYVLVAELAETLGHRYTAVRISRKAQEKNIIIMEHSFPTILQQVRNVDMEWALVHGIIRQESQFDTDAQSSAGALGLMQVMPATAKEVARKNGWPHSTQMLVTNPAHNIRIGTNYLERLIESYDGSYPLAIAAYNGGPGNVNKWLKQFGDPRKGEIDMIDWIESIPFEETRNYVQRVMEATYIYRIKLDKIQRSVNTPLHARLN